MQRSTVAVFIRCPSLAKNVLLPRDASLLRFVPLLFRVSLLLYVVFRSLMSMSPYTLLLVFDVIRVTIARNTVFPLPLPLVVWSLPLFRLASLLWAPSFCCAISTVGRRAIYR